MAGNRSCGSPRSRSRARIRSVPKPSAGHGLSDSTQRVALGKVLLELPALAIDRFGRRVRDELLVGEHLLGALDLPLDPRPLGRDVALPVAGRTDDRLEDPKGVAADLDPDAAAPVEPRRRLRLVERVQV